MRDETSPGAPARPDVGCDTAESWLSLAWRPAGSRSLADHWMRTGEPTTSWTRRRAARTTRRP